MHIVAARTLVRFLRVLSVTTIARTVMHFTERHPFSCDISTWRLMACIEPHPSFVFFTGSTKPNIASGWVLAEAAAQRSSAATTAGKDATEGGAGGAAAATGNGCRTDATTEAAADDNSSADNLYALRDIKEGMELLEDYNTYGEDPEWFVCLRHCDPLVRMIHCTALHACCTACIYLRNCDPPVRMLHCVHHTYY